MCAVDNAEAYALCLRLNREEAIIAGPSSAMALAGAFRLVPDEPGNVVVVIFPDNVFKYASSVVKHVAEVRSTKPVGSAQERRLAAMIENVRASDRLRVSNDAGHELWADKAATFVDVRDFDDYVTGHVPESLPAPLSDMDSYAFSLPQDKDAPIVTVCTRGNLSLSGVLYLTSMGYTNVRSLDGGVTAWQASGHKLDVG